MGLLRYRETGELVTETEFRFRNRKRRPLNVPEQGKLTEEFLDSEGIDPVFYGPGSGTVTGAEPINGKWYTTWEQS